MKMKRVSALILAGLLSIGMCVPVLAATQDSAGNIFEAGSNVSLPSVPFFGAPKNAASIPSIFSNPLICGKYTKKLG